MEVLDIDVKGDCVQYMIQNCPLRDDYSFFCFLFYCFIELISPPTFSDEQSLIQCSQFQKWKSSKLMCFDFGLLRLFRNKSDRLVPFKGTSPLGQNLL